MTGRCFSSTDLPLRQRRRISNLVPRVAVISSPKAGDVGPAVTPPRGCRATPIHPGCFLPLAGAPGGHVVERVGSDVTAIFRHLDRGSGKHAGQHFTESFGSVAPSIIGFAHVPNMEQANVPSVASAYVTERG